ncbi:hypothetical protein [Methylobacterium isbiliense]|uniref:hypothetical protein n=1 Tax=Methylobacterium isbiliense TaxID=315478 RepID=UPI001EE36615|nr:hypothetical protein [Methylobacterium isbiliense]MDN3625870.1 hypothetical protein [Methylobacterium isbiliense]
MFDTERAIKLLRRTCDPASAPNEVMMAASRFSAILKAADIYYTDIRFGEESAETAHLRAQNERLKEKIIEECVRADDAEERKLEACSLFAEAFSEILELSSRISSLVKLNCDLEAQNALLRERCDHLAESPSDKGAWG